jgi:hypothetical protein
MWARAISAGDEAAMRRYRSGARRHPVAHRPEIAGTGCNLLVETLPQDLVEKCFGERRRQFGTRLSVAALATVKAEGDGGLACSRRVAIHQGGEFVVGQPDLRHVRPPVGPKMMFHVQI